MNTIDLQTIVFISIYLAPLRWTISPRTMSQDGLVVDGWWLVVGGRSWMVPPHPVNPVHPVKSPPPGFRPTSRARVPLAPLAPLALMKSHPPRSSGSPRGEFPPQADTCGVSKADDSRTAQSSPHRIISRTSRHRSPIFPAHNPALFRSQSRTIVWHS